MQHAKRSAHLAMITCFIGLAGCESLSRRETISLGPGDAIAHNSAIHSIDPWPREAANAQIGGDAYRQQKSIERLNERAIDFREKVVGAKSGNL